MAVGVTLASKVSARVKALIAHNDGGDARAAACALGLDPDCLDGVLSGDWDRFSLDALAALVRGYGVSPGWLLTSHPRHQARRPASREPAVIRPASLA
jgi:hypothetical protein